MIGGGWGEIRGKKVGLGGGVKVVFHKGKMTNSKRERNEQKQAKFMGERRG